MTLLTTWWTVLQLYPVLFFLVAILNWCLGCWIGRRRLRRELTRKLSLMTDKYERATAAANCWKDEVEELAERVREDDG